MTQPTPAPDEVDRLAELERRVQHLEDVLAIQRLIAQYGPLIDSGLGSRAVAGWKPDGVYDLMPGVDNPRDVLEGREAIQARIAPADRPAQPTTRAHMLAPPLITISGQTALAIGYLQLIEYVDGDFRIARQSAHVWHLERTSDGWRVAHRSSRLFNGQTDLGSIMAASLEALESDGSLFGTGIAPQHDDS